MQYCLNVHIRINHSCCFRTLLVRQLFFEKIAFEVHWRRVHDIEVTSSTQQSRIFADTNNCLDITFAISLLREAFLQHIRRLSFFVAFRSFISYFVNRYHFLKSFCTWIASFIALFSDHKIKWFLFSSRFRTNNDMFV